VSQKTKNWSEAEIPTSRDCSLRIIDCGLADYREILELQHRLREKRRRNEIPNTVLLVEHPPVITLGARQSANKLLTGREDLTKQGIDVIEIRRGGGTTAHNPGQLVFYPILHLQQLDLGISEYIRELEAIGIELLEQLSVEAARQKGLPGLWVKNHHPADKQISTAQDAADRVNQLKSNSVLSANSAIKGRRHTTYDIQHTKKIASVGVRVSKFVTYHGMAINIQNDLTIFDLLIPCGLDDVEMTSVLKETGKHQPMSNVKRNLVELLRKHFQQAKK